MLSGGITLAEHLADQRVRVTLELWPGMSHVLPVFVGHRISIVMQLHSSSYWAYPVHLQTFSLALKSLNRKLCA